ncbi:hypothetical protein D3C86_2084760 [compost metagenome]
MDWVSKYGDLYSRRNSSEYFTDDDGRLPVVTQKFSLASRAYDILYHYDVFQQRYDSYVFAR